MQVELHLLGTSQRWLLSSARARIGRDPACEVALPPDRYPMLSREHAILTIESGRIRLTDNQSTNGTFVNGVPTTNAMLTKLDRFRLGKDGPEFEIHVIQEQTVISGSAPTRVDSGDQASAPTRIAAPAAPQAAATVVRKPEPQAAPSSRSSQSPSVVEEATASLAMREDEAMIQQKLNSLRNLVYLLVGMVAVLLGVIFYQSQQIDKNRSELSEMRRQAQSAVAQFTPALDSRLSTLDQRLNTFDQRLNQVDTKMKDTEDEFLNRLNNELPRMLDKYVDRKVKQLSEAAPKLPQPDQK